MTALFSNSLPTFPRNEHNRSINLAYLETHDLPFSHSCIRFNNSRSKILQRLPTVDKYASFDPGANPRKTLAKSRTKSINNQASPIAGNDILFPLTTVQSKIDQFNSLKLQLSSFPLNPSKYISPQEYFDLTPNSSNNPPHQDYSNQNGCSHCLSSHSTSLDDFSDTEPFELHSKGFTTSGSIQSTLFNHIPPIKKGEESYLCKFSLSSKGLPNASRSKTPDYKLDNTAFRKFMPSMKSIKRKLLPTQSFDNSTPNVFSDTSIGSLCSPNSFDRIASGSMIKESRLRNSHSADNSLHAYSNYKDFCSKDNYNNDVNTYNIIHDSAYIDIKDQFLSPHPDQTNLSPCNSASIQKSNFFRSPNYNDRTGDNQHIFLPIFRSESTPCIFSPTLRIGIKRRAGDIERPTACFSKMYNSQIRPDLSTPGVSPIEDHKRFSSRSPESVPEDWNCGPILDVKELSVGQISNQLNILNGPDSLDLQSIEEN